LCCLYRAIAIVKVDAMIGQHYATRKTVEIQAMQFYAQYSRAVDIFV